MFQENGTLLEIEKHRVAKNNADQSFSFASILYMHSKVYILYNTSSLVPSN